ncbi:MAG: class I SAM-dependent methyltransferase [Gaiellaceae bacterium]
MSADYGPSTYGERIAETYDRTYEDLPTDATVARLAELAGSGPVLELGIGTGRIALPLAARGLEVHGVDASEAMVAELRKKPGGAVMPVVIGDFAEVPVEGRYSLVFVVFNTFFALATQDDQVRCFRNVAEHLTADGSFLLEVFVPDLTRFDRDQRVSVTRIGLDEIRLDVAQHDPVRQATQAQHVVIAPGGISLYPVQIRYAWPAELDLMARLAGLRLRERWGGWSAEPFTSRSERHVSIYSAGPDT